VLPTAAQVLPTAAQVLPTAAQVLPSAAQVLHVFLLHPHIRDDTAHAGERTVADADLESLARLLEALASPTRLKILRQVADRPVHWSFLLDEFGCSRQTVSRHIKMLETAGLITTQPEPAWRVYRLKVEWVALLDDWLAAYRCKLAVDSDRIGPI
jgi:DNA-binding transcriptional ArsR family regulator